MKIQVLSDLHLDHSSLIVTNTSNADLLVVAGDVSNLGYKRNHQAVTDFFKSVCSNFNHVLWVLGNHEFYGGYWNKTLTHWKNWARSTFDNLHLLENEGFLLGDVDFLGCTFWTNLNNNCPLTENTLRYSLNDYRVITYDGELFRKLIPRDTLVRHTSSKNWLYNYASPYRKVVITHHSPSFQSVHPAYYYDHYLNGGYCSNSEDLISCLNPVLWIHGHTHHSWDYMIQDTRVVCNPRGYSDENPGFKPHLVLEI